MMQAPRRVARAATLFVATGLLLGLPASAQQAPAPQATADEATSAAKAAFEALPASERIAIQDDLVWASTYLGTLDGGFGKGTLAAIGAFEAKSGTKADGILDTAERKALASAAQARRAEVGWKLVADAATGISVSVPGKLLALSKGRPNGTLLSDAKSGLALALEAYKPDGGTLTAMFDRMKADQPGRKVTYSVLKPDWFVLTTETGTRRTYSRFASTAAGLSGFTFAYNADRADGERLAVAIANSFLPAGSPAPVAQTDLPARRPVATEEIRPGAAKVADQPAAPLPLPAPAAVKSIAAATAFLVAPGRAVTAERVADLCAQPTVGGKPLKVLARANGVALLDVGDLKPTGAAKIAGGATEAVSVVVLAQALQGKDRVLTVAAGDLNGESAMLAVATGGPGAPLFDRSGALAGLLGVAGSEPIRIAGIVPEMRQPVAPASAVIDILAGANLPVERGAGAGTLTAGAIVQAQGRNVVAITCGK